MPEFMDPFTGMTPGRKMKDRELARAIRLSLAAEQEAIHLYEALADATTNKLAAAVLQDIADEEKEHAGEFLRLLKILAPGEEKWLDNGAAEVDEMAAKLKPARKKPAKRPATKTARKKAAPKK
ncbi:MAG: rubrerythrin [Proteobacteria bacterium]|nr:rubrerythrin [Pseudomonadota bacterium]MBU1451720.1 rubrerythrin [Pseudomonadota bacterium]MBU2469671.1 rubrerythrin [Pseudomonadota bacterium]MBU2518063.1 rubrerythrin [Pseudomonadota bacterium]